MKFYLTENHLTTKQNFSARVVSDKSHDLEGIINLMLSKRNLVSRTDIVAVFSAFFETVENCIKLGENITLPIFNISYSITGVFENEDESFNREKHHVNVNMNNGLQIKRAIEQIKLNKIDTVVREPVLHHFNDLASHTVDDQLTKNSLFELTGSQIKIAGDKPDIGLYFVADDGTETKVVLVADNTNKKIVGQTPDLATGSYHLHIKTQSTKGTYTTKTLKESTSNFSLSLN
jgi:hypothetical protein